MLENIFNTGLKTGFNAVKLWRAVFLREFHVKVSEAESKCSFLSPTIEVLS